MTITLREEIDIELKKHLNKWKYVPTMMEVADITIKVFEKQINERIPTKHDSNTVEEVNYTNGWNHAISEVRAMLK